MEKKPARAVLCEFCATSLSEHFDVKKVALDVSGATEKNRKCSYCGKKIYIGGTYELKPKRKGRDTPCR